MILKQLLALFFIYVDTMKSLKPSLLPFEISEKVEKLTATISNLDIKTAVEMVEKELGQILNPTVTLHDIAPAIGSLPFEAKELVLTAIEGKAYTLLKLLQKTYIWSDKSQYHWFKALSYDGPWYDKEMWENSEPFPMDWKGNLWAVCKVDNAALAKMLRGEVRESALESFDEKLLLLCIEYDSINIFESVGFKPSQLERHIASLAKNSAVKLLQLYQAYTKMPHLHLEEYPFPSKSPTNIKDFEFLLNHGHACFPVNEFIAWFCREGKLDFLKHLNERVSGFETSWSSLKLAAKSGWCEIIQWADHLNPISGPKKLQLVALMPANIQFQIFDLMMDAPSAHINGLKYLIEWIIDKIVETEALNALQRLDEKYQIEQGQQEWADSAAINCKLLVLRWLYEKFNLFPRIKFLKDATADMLDWVKSKRDNLINAKLVEHGRENFELLRWVFENSSQLIPTIRKHASTSQVCNMETALWFNKNLETCSFDMDWAYKVGNLEAIKWAKENCGIDPSLENSHSAAANGHFHIISWIYDTYPELVNRACVLQAAIESGHLGIADYLMVDFISEEKLVVRTNHDLCSEQHLDTLRWVHERGFIIDSPQYERHQAIKREDLQTIKWLTKAFPSMLLEPNQWIVLVSKDSHKVYECFLDIYPRERQLLAMDGELAFTAGHLDVVKVILEKDLSLAKELSSLVVNSKNYHVKQWLVAKGKWFGEQ